MTAGVEPGDELEPIEVDDNNVDDPINIDDDDATTADEKLLEPGDLVFDAETDSKGDRP